MKNLFVSSLFLLSAIGFIGCQSKQQPAEFKISGTIHHLDTGWISKVYLLKISNIFNSFAGLSSMVIDSATIDSKGYYELKNTKVLNDSIALYRLNVIPKSQYPNGGGLYEPDNHDNYFFLSIPKDSVISIETDSITHFLASSKHLHPEGINIALSQYLQLRSENQEKYSDFWNNSTKYSSNPDSMKIYKQKSKEIWTKSCEVYKIFSDTTKCDLASMLCLSDLYYSLEKDTIYFNKIDKKYTNEMPASIYTGQINRVLLKIKRTLLAVPLGSPAPEIISQDTNNATKKLSDFKGNYVLLDFWASWCEPCRDEIRETLKPLYKKYHSAGLEMISVSCDTERKKWTNGIKTSEISWHQLSDLQKKPKALTDYEVHEIPAIFIISPEGKILAKGLRGKDLENFVGNLFKK